MDIIIICNGLGNQMSQYAFYLQKKKLNANTRILFDRKSKHDHNGFELTKVFNIKYKESIGNYLLYFLFRLLGIKKYPAFTKPLIKIMNIFNIRLINEKENYEFDDQMFKKLRGITFYYGGWHSEKYFSEINNDVSEVFSFSDDLTEEVSSILEHIKSTNSVAIHIRRGDFMSEINFARFGSVCTLDYFQNAIKLVEEKVENPHYFLFSNDLNWIKDNFNLKKFTIVDCVTKADAWCDMMLMSKCKFNINSNSTFSWWSAWLNINQNKLVITPYYFINNLETPDFYPASWTRITTKKQS